MIKKYWPIITLGLIAVLGLSFYYIDLARASNVQFQLEKLEGKETHMDNVLLQTSFYKDHIYEDYYVEKDQSSQIDNTIGEYIENYDMRLLVKEQKNFFRGKQFTGRHYYNDEHSLAYVYVDDQYQYEHPNNALYVIDLLNKKTNERTKLQLTAKIEQSYLWQTVEHITFIENELKVLSIRTFDNSEEAVILTTFDLENGKVQEKELIAPIKDLHLTFHYQSDTYNSNEYALFSHYNNDVSEGIPVQTIYQFNSKTNELLEVPYDNSEHKYSECYIYGEYVIITSNKDNELHIRSYNVKTKKWINDYKVNTSLNSLSDWAKVQLIGEKLYFSYEVEKGSVIEIVDFNSGQKLYAGLLTAQGVSGDHSIYIQKSYIVD